MTDSSSPSPHSNIWAPWRMEYIDTIGNDDNGCFLCSQRDHPDRDESNFVLWRGQRCLAMLNRFPYTGGHSMIAPFAHVGELADIDDATMLEMTRMLRDLQAATAKALRAEGFNVGINLGRCAGAGLPGHLHMHLVPRWSGDTNFMPVFGDVRVIPEWLGKTFHKIRQAAHELGLPRTDASER